MSSSVTGGTPSGSGLPAVFAELHEKHGWNFDTLIGEGGFAYVYRERCGPLDRAVKISKSPVSEPQQREDVDREFEILRRSQGHPRLLALIQHEFVREHLVTVWELAAGTLEAELRKFQCIPGNRGLRQELVLRWMREAAEGIDFLNLEQRTYHRDIKPHNLFLLHGHLKVGDLGLAKVVEQSTASNTGRGTLGYSPPESLRNELHPSIDVYGLAATYVRLRTGRPPFGHSIAEIVARGKHGAFETAGLSDAERDVLTKALSPEPDQRPSSARELVELLSATLTQNHERPTKTTGRVSIVLPGSDPEPETLDRGVASTTPQQASSISSADDTDDGPETTRHVREAVIYILAVVVIIGFLGLLHHWSAARAASQHGPSLQDVAASSPEAPGFSANSGATDGAAPSDPARPGTRSAPPATPTSTALSPTAPSSTQPQ